MQMAPFRLDEVAAGAGAITECGLTHDELWHLANGAFNNHDQVASFAAEVCLNGVAEDF